MAHSLAATSSQRRRGWLRPRIVMGVLSRYLIRTVLGYTALVMIVLLALGALFMFIGQQDDIGVGNYTATQALLFVALNLPSYLFQLLPVAALIGSLLGLGNLARGSELIVMRSAGVTTLRFCLWLGTAGLILSSLMFVIGEYVAPPLGQYARQLKVFAKFDEFALAGNRATWVRDGDTIISVDQQSASTRFGGIKVFQVDRDRRLVSVGRAESASVKGGNVWRLEKYVGTSFARDSLTATVDRAGERDVRTSLSSEFLGLAIAEPDTMGLRDLRGLHRAPAAQRTAVGPVRDGLLVTPRAVRRRAAGDHAGAAVLRGVVAQFGAGRAHRDRRADRCWIRAAEPDAREQRGVVRPAALGGGLAADGVARCGDGDAALA